MEKLILMFQSWNETLENIIKDPRNDKFKIIVNNFSYPVPLSYPLAISSIITEQYLKDPTLKKFNIKITTNENKNINDEKFKTNLVNSLKVKKYQVKYFFKLQLIFKTKKCLKNGVKSKN